MKFLSLCKKCLQIMGVIGYNLLSKHPATALCNKDVILDPDTSEVGEFRDSVIIQELAVLMLRFPLVYQHGDEIDAGLIGHDESGLEPASQTKAVGAELVRWAYLVIESHVSLHVMYVHAHHMAQAVLQEQGMGTGGNGVIGIAAHQAQLLEAVGHEAAYIQMHVHPFHVGAGLFNDQVMAGFDN